MDAAHAVRDVVPPEGATISHAEQGERLLARLTDPTKHWKYHPSDLDSRDRWGDYRAAYAEALSRCGTDAARGAG